MALDYRMALARGLVPPVKKAEESILKAAGGDNVFKSEAWWNEQYDKSIDKGWVTKADVDIMQTQYLTSASMGTPGGYKAATGNIMNPLPANVVRGAFGTRNAGQPQSRQVKVGTETISTQNDFDAEDLNIITASQKEMLRKTKREASQEKSKSKRKGRAVGGLLSKSKPVEVKGLATAMPDLGVQSIYGSDSTLGVA
tara:strand:- start:3521 stop:4114 length:594 start_codon:yes stop_codon:yes gene_type:complete